MIIKQLELGMMANFTYLVCDEAKKVCAVIDPGWEVEKIIEAAKKENCSITHILLTHTHFDHANGASMLAKKTGAKVYVHVLEAGAGTEKIDNGDKTNVGGLSIECIHTPGHTPGSTCFLVDKALFTGDTLFVDGIGRTDLDGSDPLAMEESLQKLSKLPGGTIVYPGHDYGAEPVTSIEEQKRRNPYMGRKL